MHVAQLWRYPVKSMAGEQLQEATLTPLGIAGDRILHVEGPEGDLRTARRYPRLLGHHAVLAGVDVLVDGERWDDPSVRAAVEQAAGRGAALVPSAGPERFDVLPLLVTSDGALAELGHEPRRYRPNLVIGGVPGLAERQWEGRVLAIGTARIQLADLRGRCVMTTWHPDTLEQDVGVLRDVVRRFNGTFGLNAAVRQGGAIRVGDPVTLLPAPADGPPPLDGGRPGP
ncbi:MAG: MOSC N-terminal beta barrel domain-containing protein [Gemmatimonadetes bacterium]|nr:MOSC N-terminal beta barrel domain-containing protein [Gemmatimonadota bacterium]